jgi:large subunit ribosomal protein L24
MPKAKSMRVRKDDTVIVTSGKDRGKTGKVLRTEPGKHRVYVEGLNIVKRHTRPRSIKDTQKGEAGGIIEQEGPIHVSNVMIVDPQDNKPSRVGIRTTEEGKRQRYLKRTGNALD